jgi:hypothetical protein
MTHLDLVLSQLFSAKVQTSTSFWQNSPAQESLHVHVNLSTRSVHAEPFMHGDDTQSSSFTSQL